MEKMQEFIDFIFYEVWCKASANGPFGLNLFDANTDLREVMEAFFYSDAQGADFFYGHVERIYGLFSVLPLAQINQFQQWYHGNNDLEAVCANDPAAQLVRYVDITVADEVLGNQIATFFKGLYSQSLLRLAALAAKIGDIDDHYQTFVRTNDVGKCPFCGINDLLGEYHNKREAYDHYLPKVLYPFNSINFLNLVPACHHCNSSYKTSKDPAYSPKDPLGAAHRRTVFYPFETETYNIELKITLGHADIANLTDEGIALEFGPAALVDKIDTWKDVYGIEERYKAKLCGVNDGKYWLAQVMDECKVLGKEPVDILNMRAEQALNRPYADCNFLRKPFLDACKHHGLFES
jgi:hypothetical protein